MTDDDTGVSRRTLAEKLAYLYSTAIPHARKGRPWTDHAVAAAINEAAGESVISASYIVLLRTGRKDNPTKRHIEALEALFGVPQGYLLDERDTGEADDPIRILAMKARSLSQGGLTEVTRMIDFVAQLERDAARGGKP